ncbi:hypothetical protein [Noviherbaspirillum aerium]|uniref:hypothetical protein n=1 Tax=Noviherbaspirillum aerium TaxID=2588497 RepID=UPI00124C8911|nr:hypothetical protein [Noviherbaspirillum aerium]
MSTIPRFTSLSMSDLLDAERYAEVKSRQYPYGSPAANSSHDLLRAPAQPQHSQHHLPAPPQHMGGNMAWRLRRAASTHALSASARVNEGQSSDYLVVIMTNLNRLKEYAAGFRFKPDDLRHQIRREVMKAQTQAFNVNKSLEQILYAMNKAKNDLKEPAERLSDEDVFRQSLTMTFRERTSLANPTAFQILLNKYKSQKGMGDAAAAIKAGTTTLAFPVVQAAQKLIPGSFQRKRDGRQHKEELPTGLDSRRQDTETATRTGRPEGISGRDMDFDAALGLRSESMSTINNDPDVIPEGASVPASSPADIVKRISELVEANGASGALVEMEIEHAVILSEFKGSLNHLKELMEP